MALGRSCQTLEDRIQTDGGRWTQEQEHRVNINAELMSIRDDQEHALGILTRAI